MKARLFIYLAAACAVTPVFACVTYNAAQVSQAIQNSPYASAATKASSCTWGGAAAAESGGNTCASNGNNFGVLQLTRDNLPTGVVPSQYLNEPLQQQVDTWLQQAGPNGQGSSFNTINNTATNGGSIGGMQMTPGVAAACVQFGGGICSRDLASIQSTGQCPSPGNVGSARHVRHSPTEPRISTATTRASVRGAKSSIRRSPPRAAKFLAAAAIRARETPPRRR